MLNSRREECHDPNNDHDETISAGANDLLGYFALLSLAQIKEKLVEGETKRNERSRGPDPSHEGSFVSQVGPVKRQAGCIVQGWEFFIIHKRELLWCYFSYAAQCNARANSESRGGLMYLPKLMIQARPLIHALQRFWKEKFILPLLGIYLDFLFAYFFAIPPMSEE